MKRFVALVVLLALLLSLGGCSKEVAVVDHLFNGLRTYDRDSMSEVLTEFPDNSRFVYVDDIFNDEGYRRIYEQLYPAIQYRIVSANSKAVKVKVTMPNIQSLYAEVSAWVMSEAMNDPELQARLEENETNGVLLIQEIMYSYALNQPDQIEVMTKEFQLFLTEDGKIQCTDSLCALITGNLFLSKNIRIGSGE